MKKLLAFALIILACSALAKQRSTRQKLSTCDDASVAADTMLVLADTLRGDTLAASLKISGYEKPLRSRHETMLLTNADTLRTLTSVAINITYIDMLGRTLHSRTTAANIIVPPRETRMLDIKSWDVNQLFYYHLNPPARTSTQATPYRVTVTATSATYTL